MIIQFASILTAPPSAYSQYKRVTSDRKVLVIRSIKAQASVVSK